MNEDYVCPSCGDDDDKNLVELKGIRPIVKSGYGDYDELVLFACKKCSCVQVNNWKFEHKAQSRRKPKV